jgi:hypothetical protein
MAPNALTCPRWLRARRTTGVLRESLWDFHVRCLQIPLNSNFTRNMAALLTCGHARMYAQALDAMCVA